MSDGSLDSRLLVLTFGAFVMGTGNLVFTGMLGELAGDLGVSEGVTGLLVTIYAVVVIVGSSILVSFTGTITRKRLLLGTVLLYGVANVVALFFPRSSYSRSFAHSLLSVQQSSSLVLSQSPLLSCQSESGVKQLGLSSRARQDRSSWGSHWGRLLGVRGWRATFAFVGGIAVLAFIGIWVFLPLVEDANSTVGLQALQIIRQPAVIVNIGLITTAFTSVFVEVTFIGPLLRNTTGFDDTGVSLLQLLLGIGGISGATIGGYGSDRWNITKMLLGIFIGVILGIFPFDC